MDLDENRDGGAIETLHVLVFNTAGTDSETVILHETAVASGEFYGNINVILGSGGVAYDGVLSLSPGDRIGISYTDSLDAAGNIQDRLHYVDIAGHGGTLTASADTITVGQALGITVIDVDENRDDGVVETLHVMAFNTAGTDSETVVLQETAVASGEFYGVIHTVYGTAGVAHDGILSIEAGDIIRIVYTDSLDTTGGISEIDLHVDVGGGTDGILRATRVVQALDAPGGRDTLRVLVTDADLNIDISKIDTAFAKFESLHSNEIEWVKLLETDVNTGVFQGRLPTVSGGVAIDNDGVMTLTPWDTLLVSYTDSLTSIGDVNTLQDTIYVVNLFGDLSANNVVGALDASLILQISVELITPTKRDSLVGDVDGNRKLQAFDASNVLQYSVGLINRFGVQTRIATEMDPKNHPFLKPAFAPNHVALGILQRQSDGSYVLPIHIEAREGVVSGMFKMESEAEMEVFGVDMVDGYENFLTAYRTDSKTLRLAFAGSVSGAKGAGSVAHIRFRSESEKDTKWILKDAMLNGQMVDYAIHITDEMHTLNLPEKVALYQNAPNPFNPTTSIRYALPDAQDVRLDIYSLVGQHIRTLVSGNQDAGIYFVVWDGKDDREHQVSSGIYILKLEAGLSVQTRKMMLLK